MTEIFTRYDPRIDSENRFREPTSKRSDLISFLVHVSNRIDCDQNSFENAFS
ncbi:hypothetical protein LEP1GSC191_3046 [Leptospira borgpetersenii serovar Mini str. 201000851]|uniref:Uncharacterized protein n=2 Tax=Leptospira borgpetersenii TaxID=174 RepID=M3F8D5_LEPBO|nr:hypothetical protein LEP1GSC128_2668 [Leptospira borgpetersenii str. 200801926]EMF98172.1 hypothetical protein LEP1GSC123_0019 [Leptospira borgpetersenii str. 200701203]ENO62227.1 hypothetical protein LEP1GSC191_3046 [Leptospira borgpetersenii serovar Mini str. 201000851]